MLKFLSKIIKITLSGLIWSYVYLLITNSILIYFWNFSTLSANSWKLLRFYWERGGIIRTSNDYMLLGILFLFIPIWLYGWVKMSRISYFKILLAPLNWYNNRIISKYGASSSRILLKNMGRSKKIKDVIEEMSKPQSQSRTDQEVNKIRSAVADKISSVKHE